MDYLRNHRLQVIVLVIALLLLGLGTWQYFQTGELSLGGRPSATTSSLPATTTNPNTTAAVVSPLPEGQSSALRLARLFVERFGTFSSQSQYEGIRDLTSVTTSSFQTWMNTVYIPELQKTYPTAHFAAQTTTVMSTTVKESTDAAATVIVRTQQVLTIDGQASVVTNPAMEVSLVRQDSGWLVDRAVWQKPPTP